MRIILSLIIAFLSLTSYGQKSILKKKAETVTIESTRINVEKLRSPFAISKLDLTSLLESKHKTSLNEYLNQVPGVFCLNQFNSAQDLRVSIRGFGARSAFGIRGVKLILDGVPLTTPDGQGQVDNIWVGGLKSMEVVRGASSALYGNASGGVLNLSSFDDEKWGYSSLGTRFGSFGQLSIFYDAKLTLGKNKIYGQFNYGAGDGYRQNSAFENYNYNFKISREISKNSELAYLISFLDSPVGQDAGGVNLESIDADRAAAREQNLLYKGGESVRQWNHSLQYKNEISKEYTLVANGFYSTREFDGLLPFVNGGAVDLDRVYGGLSSHLQYAKVFKQWKHDFLIGYDYAFQNDLRIRYENNQGVRGLETLNQNEIFINSAGFASFQSQTERILFKGGLRYDYNQINLEDNFLADADDSGELTLPNLSPSLSVSYRLKKKYYVFAGYSYGFETPTLSELANRPDNQGGLNPELNAQESNNFELGYKSEVNENVKLGLTLFNIESKNELLPYEIATFPGRTFFRNSGRTSRQGVEIDFDIALEKGFSLQGNYSYSNFKFSEYNLDGVDLSGNRLPGIPEHNAHLSTKYETKKGMIEWSNSIFSSIFVNDSNSVEVDPFILGNIRASYKFQFILLKFVPFVGVNNLYNVDYFDNLRLNAFGARYYEAAPGINFYGGFKIDL